MKWTTIEEISKSVSSGLTPLRSNIDFWSSGEVPWVKTEQLGQKDIYDSNEKISIKALEETSIKLNPKNTLSIAMYGEGKTRGSVSILRNEMTTNQACCNVVVDDSIGDYEYVYYYLTTQYEQLRGLSSGVRKNLNSNDIKGFPIKLPDLISQKKVSKILSSFDSEISLNNRINKELEAMAKLIYDYWFVQFDFPMTKEQAEAIGKPAAAVRPYKSSGGKMIYNEQLKRVIPEGWGVKELGDIEPNIITGKTPSTKVPENFNGNIPFICIGDVRGNMHVVETELTLTEQGANTQSKKYIAAGSICVTCIASPGLVAFASSISQTNQQLNSIVCSKSENRYFLYFYLTDYFNYAKAKTGNTFANMNKGDFSSIIAVHPTVKVLKKFEKKVHPMIDSVLNNLKQNQKLSELRDWLLPMLMNGQVKVSEPGFSGLKDGQDLGMAAEPEAPYNQ